MHLGIATMWQMGAATREFAQEFKQCTRDMRMAMEDAEVHLVPALNQATLSCLDAYVTMCGGDNMAHLETIQDRFHQVPYIQMVYLK